MADSPFKGLLYSPSIRWYWFINFGLSGQNPGAALPILHKA